jgi:hypothetical protein
MVGLMVGGCQAYFDQFQCTTSQRYQNELVALTTSLLKLFEGMNIPYFMDFASLLAIMRKVKRRFRPLFVHVDSCSRHLCVF